MIKDFIRRFKFSFSFYNYFKKEQLIHNQKLYKKYGLKKKYYSSISSKDFIGLPDEVNWLDKENSRSSLPNNEFFQKLPLQFKEPLQNWSDNGYVVLPKIFETEVDKINTEVNKLLKDKVVKWKNGNKIMFAIQKSPYLSSIGLNPQLKGIMEMLLGRKIELFQSINFLSGSEQRTHSDFIHMSTFPKGNLIAVWIALEDMSEENGPLHYYPGSHKLPCILNKDYHNDGTILMVGNKTYDKYEDEVENVIEKSKLKKEKFIAKKGDALIWHSNLLHGGEEVLNTKLTRKSMVFHYYAHDVICYHEITQRPTIMEKLPKFN
jgi:ectoine hydroxylase-related dioxygenase (phytanoyl-CoA dioxygenase family)